MAEVVLAARVELHVGGKHAAVLVEEADEPAVVVDVAMADDQRLDLCRIDLEQPHVVDDRRRGVAEVEQDRAALVARAAIRDRARGPIRCAARCAHPHCGPGRGPRAPRRSRCCRAGTDRAADRPARGSRVCRWSAPGSAARWRISMQEKPPAADAAANAADRLEEVAPSQIAHAVLLSMPEQSRSLRRASTGQTGRSRKRNGVPRVRLAAANHPARHSAGGATPPPAASSTSMKPPDWRCHSAA